MILDFFRLVNESVISRSSRAVGQGYTYGDSTRQKFTGYERDEETNLDYAQARMYSNQLGRFTTVDPLLSSGEPVVPHTWNRFAYVMNNPLRFVDPTGLCSAPSALKKGQVGICFEAFIAAKRVGVGGLGYGDGRTHVGNDPNRTGRITVWVIVETNKEKVWIASKNEEIAESKISTGKGIKREGTMGEPDSEETDTYVSLQGTATTDATISNIQATKGEDDFGKGVDVTVSIANGTNGAQQLGRDTQVAGALQGGTAGAIVAGIGKAIEAASPAGTIDGNMTVRITGNGQATLVGGATRGYPSYAGYVYTKDANGEVRTQTIFKRDENEIEDLTRPMTPIPK